MAEKFKIQRVEDDIEKAIEEKVAETGLLPSHSLLKALKSEMLPSHKRI